MIGKICSVNETNNPDGVCNNCKYFTDKNPKIRTGIFSSELFTPQVPVYYKNLPRFQKSTHSKKAKDTSSKFKYSDFEIPMIYKKLSHQKSSNKIVKKVHEEWKKRRRIVTSKITNPPCFGNYLEGLCNHCLVNKQCKAKVKGNQK